MQAAAQCWTAKFASIGRIFYLNLNFQSDSNPLVTNQATTMLIRKIQLTGRVAQLIKFNYLAWLGFFLIYTLYALVWRQFNDSEYSQYTAMSSFIWFIKEWSPWLVLSPLLLCGFEYFKDKKHAVWLSSALALVVLFFAIVMRYFLIHGEYSDDFIALYFVMMPKYAPVVLLSALGWLIWGKHSIETIDKAETGFDSMHIEHQGLTRELNYSEIIYFKSAGNYVEIWTEDCLYLKRTSLTALLSDVPKNIFMQVHRSYAINIVKLKKVTSVDNGGAIATLKSQHKVPISKRFKNKVKTLPIPQQ